MAQAGNTQAFRKEPAGRPDAIIAASPVAENQGDVGEVMFVVRVTGLRAVPWKSYGAMRAAVAAYEKHKSLAPDAVFRFAVMPPAGMKLPPNFALRVRTDKGQEYPIRLEHGELFTPGHMASAVGRDQRRVDRRGQPAHAFASQRRFQSAWVPDAHRQHRLGQRRDDRIRLQGAAASSAKTLRGGDL